MAKLYYTPGEAADILGVTANGLRDLIERGDLPALRISPRITRIPIAAFDRWRDGYRPQQRSVSIGPARRVLVVGEGEGAPHGDAS